MKAMILAAGKGTRLQPLTDNKPKALVQIQGKPLLNIVINKLKNDGFTNIIINVYHFANQIIDYVNSIDFGINISISDEREQLLDTGGGILKAKEFFSGSDAFLVYNVDILSDINLFDLYNAHIKSDALATLAVKERPTTRQLLFDSESNLCQWRNVQTGEIKNTRNAFGTLTPLAFSGIHVLSTQIFNQITEKGTFSIIDSYLRLAASNQIKSYIHNFSKWFDMGRYEQVLEFNKHGNLKGLL